MVDGAPDVAAGVDAGDDEVERVAEEPEAAVDDAQAWWPADRPDLVDAVDPGIVDLGPDQVQGSERCTGAGVLPVGGHDGDIAEGQHRPGKDV